MIFFSVVYLQDSVEYTHNLFIKTDISQLLDIKGENNTSQMHKRIQLGLCLCERLYLPIKV